MPRGPPRTESEAAAGRKEALPETADLSGVRALESLAERMIRENPALVVVTREVGCGLVPLDAEERLWREQAGRLSCRLAEQAAEVYRVCCGQAQKIKG